MTNLEFHVFENLTNTTFMTADSGYSKVDLLLLICPKPTLRTSTSCLMFALGDILLFCEK